MWAQAATSHNVSLLRERGVDFLGPEFGPVASGDVGLGRLLEPAQIVERLLAGPSRDLAGKRLIISAGPTLEDIDPVRFIGNRSSGKMGFALARRASARGAEVDLVSGPVQLQTPVGVRRHDVRSALELQRALQIQLERPADALIMAAAVGDFRAQQTLPRKLKRTGDWTLTLIQNPDVIASLADHPGASAVTRIAFAVETGQDSEIIQHAQAKLKAKRVHAIVANRAEDALGRDDNRAHWLSEEGVRSFPTLDKHDLADAILDCLLQRWQYTRP
jgi:phosphopantothenoylcysteine decarboxylase/phosphopantothenate--cysteine ligase